MTTTTTSSPADRDPDSEGGFAISALERAAALLNAFDESHRELTLAALVRRSGLPRSTVHRTAERMIRLGWLDKPGLRYRIGRRMFELSGLVPLRSELREAALPFMQDLYVAVGTTVQLGVLDGPNVLIVEKISGHRRMPMLSSVGSSIPAHCSGLGRVLLAHAESMVVEQVLDVGLTPRTPRTVTSELAWRQELAAIPERGWAADREEGNLGVTCVAAPVFDGRGAVVAGLSVTGPSTIVLPERIASAVRLAAASASRALTQRSRTIAVAVPSSETRQRRAATREAG